MDEEDRMDGPPQVWTVETDRLLKHWDPFGAWLPDPISNDEITQALDAGEIDGRCYDLLTDVALMSVCQERAYHIARIAWMVVHPDPTPITLSFEHPPERCPFRFVDGNHRLAAAAYCDDMAVPLIALGDHERFAATFPGAIPIHPHHEGDES